LQYGIGTLWDRFGLTDGCQYGVNTAATAEYQALSGCTTSIPIEQGGGGGTACSHWDESCFKGELMTGFATGGLEMSRMTLAGLQDLGYTVDYNQAEAFPSSELDPSCVCNAVKEETKKYGGFKFGGFTMFVRAGNVGPSNRPKLSKEGSRAARRYGRMYLKKKKAIRMQKGKNGGGDYKYLGDNVGENSGGGYKYLGDSISVLYMEGDRIYSVEVSLPTRTNVFARIRVPF
jgi:hypothetical protein